MVTFGTLIATSVNLERFVSRAFGLLLQGSSAGEGAEAAERGERRRFDAPPLHSADVKTGKPSLAHVVALPMLVTHDLSTSI